MVKIKRGELIAKIKRVAGLPGNKNDFFTRQQLVELLSLLEQTKQLAKELKHAKRSSGTKGI